MSTEPYFEDGITIFQADCADALPQIEADSVHCCVTSPPYWGLRDYGVAGQIGMESTPEEYVSQMVEIFREVRRVLRDDGTLWLNLGDSYCSGNRDTYDQVSDNKGKRGTCNTRPKQPDYLKNKDLVGIPWRVAFALQADGWYLRADIIWHKPNPMPESVRDRPTKAHEYLFLLSKSERYYYDAEAIAERTAYEVPDCRPKSGDYSVGSGRNDGGMHRSGGFVTGTTRNKRSVWTVATEPYPEAHFATFPPALIEPCIKAGCPAGGTVLDPFGGSGTTMQVARAMGCGGVMIELNAQYCSLAAKRLSQGILFATLASGTTPDSDNK